MPWLHKSEETESTPRPPMTGVKLPNPRALEKAYEKIDVRVLEGELKRNLEGEVRFDRASRALYAEDSSNYNQPPIGVIVPRSKEDVVRTLEICRAFGAPILARGGGTSLTGSTCNIAVVIDFSKYLNRVIETSVAGRWARVEPGAICDDLRDAAEPYGLTFGPDPSTHDRCVVGGMIGNNSCGTHAQMGGRVSENVEELEILTYDGLRTTVGKTGPEQYAQILREGGRRADIYRRLKSLGDRYADRIRRRFPKIPRRVSGYNLDDLLPENGFHVARALVGSESTLVTVLEAKVRLIYSPAKRTLVTIGFPDIFTAADRVPEILLSGPIAIEALDDKLLDFVKKKGGKKAHELGVLPHGSSFMMVEYEGETKAESNAKARRLTDALARSGFPRECVKVCDQTESENALWDIRESGLGVTAFVPGQPDTWPGWEDAGVPPDRLGDYLRDYRKLLDRHGLDCSVYGHFSQGCVHCRIDFDLKTKKGIARYRAFIEDAADLVSRYGGSYSSEHGDGQSRGELWPKMFGPELMQAMREFKSIWDPDYKMNPGKLLGDPPYLIDENLRIGAGYRESPPSPTHFQFPDDGGFNHATLRCVGVGKCRKTSGEDYMCPSFKATREEAHTTRGRAHILFDMAQGRIVTNGWKSEAVKSTLELCLACKGCKGDCPVSVDIATLKAEFLSHYYKGRLRPRHAYAMGLIHFWAKLGSTAPELANFLLQTPVLSGLAKRLGGIAPQCDIPLFANETFKSWYARRRRKDNGTPVILWVDTFTNFFHPEIGKATIETLEDAGFSAIVPSGDLCCGRPLYDYGFLDRAKSQLVEILGALEKPIKYGIPIVGMEPSCVAVFKDELTNLFPNDPRAQRLKKLTFMLGDFLVTHAKNYDWPKQQGKALIQGHCHQAAVVGLSGEEQALKKMGLETEMMNAGCCGLAGSFGFEKDKYDLSVKIANYAMVPKIEKTPKTTFLVASGFSCHTQIGQTTGRNPLHLAQIIQKGIWQRKAQENGEVREEESVQRKLGLAACVVALGLAAGLWWMLSTKRPSGASSRQNMRLRR